MTGFPHMIGIGSSGLYLLALFAHLLQAFLAQRNARFSHLFKAVFLRQDIAYQAAQALSQRINFRCQSGKFIKCGAACVAFDFLIDL